MILTIWHTSSERLNVWFIKRNFLSISCDYLFAIRMKLPHFCLHKREKLVDWTKRTAECRVREYMFICWIGALDTGACGVDMRWTIIRLFKIKTDLIKIRHSTKGINVGNETWTYLLMLKQNFVNQLYLKHIGMHVRFQFSIALPQTTLAAMIGRDYFDLDCNLPMIPSVACEWRLPAATERGRVWVYSRSVTMPRTGPE